MSKRSSPFQFREPGRQALRILYLEDVAAIRCPVDVLERITTLRDHAGTECWLAEDVYAAWREQFANEGAA